jgi:hypothetical protein
MDLMIEYVHDPETARHGSRAHGVAIRKCLRLIQSIRHKRMRPAHNVGVAFVSLGTQLRKSAERFSNRQVAFA